MNNSIEKTKKYNHLNLEEMLKIEAYLNTNENISTIAKYLSRSKATIGRELKRNGNKKTGIYDASFVQRKAVNAYKEAIKRNLELSSKTKKT